MTKDKAQIKVSQIDGDTTGKLGKYISQLDADGDGEVNSAELVAFLQHSMHKQAQEVFLKKLYVFLCGIAVVLTLTNFGLAFVALDLAKDYKVSGSNLVDGNDNLVEVTHITELTTGTILSLTSQTPRNLIYLKDLRIATSAGEALNYQISYVKADTANAVTNVLTLSGTEIEIVAGSSEIVVDGESKTSSGRRGRRLADDDGATSTSFNSNGALCNCNGQMSNSNRQNDVNCHFYTMEEYGLPYTTTAYDYIVEQPEKAYLCYCYLGGILNGGFSDRDFFPGCCLKGIDGASGTGAENNVSPPQAAGLQNICPSS